MTDSDYDFTVSANQSFCKVWPENERATEWFREWTEGDLLKSGDGFAVEHRYIQDLCHGILEAGFTITKDGKTVLRSAEGDLVLE